MQMLDVLKRLAELDAGNPQVYKDTPTLNKEDVAEDKGDMDHDGKDEPDSKEYMDNKDAAIKKAMAKEDIVDEEQVDECGMMPMGGMHDHHTPASINITADSGDELSAMLRDIMTLAGQGHHDHGMAEPMDMPGDAPPPAEISTDGGDGTDIMRSMIDKLNPGDDEGDDEGDDAEMKEYDNTPSDPNKKNEFDANQFAHQENQPGQGDRMDGTSPKGHPTMEEVEKNLFAEYKRFISEN